MILLNVQEVIEVTYEQKELVELGLRIASGAYQYDDIRVWIHEHKN